MAAERNHRAHPPTLELAEPGRKKRARVRLHQRRFGLPVPERALTEHAAQFSIDTVTKENNYAYVIETSP
jgi:hypothetical protein